MTGLDLPSVGYAASAAIAFAVANNLQRDAAALVPMSAGGPVRLLLRLLRARRWLLGSLLALGALGLHAVALARGGVIVVQAVLAGGLIAALAIEALKEHRRMHAAEVAGSVLLVTGVVLLLGVGRPGGGQGVDLRVRLWSALIVVVIGAIGLTAIRRHHHVRATAVITGVAAGVCFAVDAVFLKGAANSTDDLDALPAAMDLLGFLGASALGNLLVQRAFQFAPLRFVLPAVTAADPLTAFVAGRWLLGERLHGGSIGTAAVSLGLAAIAIGIVVTTGLSPHPPPTHTVPSLPPPADENGDDGGLRPSRREGIP